MTSQYANWQIMTIVGLTVLVSILLITLFSMARHVKRLRLRLRHSAEVLVPSNTAPIIIASQRRTWNYTNWSELNWYSVIWEPKGQVKGLPMVAISDCDLYFKTKKKNECALRDFFKDYCLCRKLSELLPRHLAATLTFSTKHGKDSCDSMTEKR